MTEKKGPFDAAINCLTVMADRDFANGSPHRGEFRAAIRVLKAAEGCKHERAIRTLATLLKIYVESGLTIPDLERNLKDGSVKEIRALLESLPDKP